MGTAKDKHKKDTKAPTFVSGILLGIVTTFALLQYHGSIDPRITMMDADSLGPVVTEHQRKPDPPGWHSVRVFVGNESASETDSSTERWFAQVQQDRIVWELLGPNGYFIDLAANNPTTFSNTLALERHGWDGLCIEPNPTYWFGLSHRKCQVAGALIGGGTVQEVQVKLQGEYGGIVGLIDGAAPKKYRNTPVGKRHAAPFLHVLKLFEAPAVIDYLSLDVEGAEYLIMKDFPFDHYRIRLMTVERPQRELMDLFKEKNYIFLRQLSGFGETLWAHQSMGLTPDDPKLEVVRQNTIEGKLFFWLKD